MLKINKCFLITFTLLVFASAVSAESTPISPKYTGPKVAQKKSVAKQDELSRAELAAQKNSEANQNRAMLAPSALEKKETKSTKRIPLSRSGGSASANFVSVK